VIVTVRDGWRNAWGRAREGQRRDEVWRRWATGRCGRCERRSSGGLGGLRTTDTTQLQDILLTGGSKVKMSYRSRSRSTAWAHCHLRLSLTSPTSPDDTDIDIAEQSEPNMYTSEYSAAVHSPESYLTDPRLGYRRADTSDRTGEVFER